MALDDALHLVEVAREHGLQRLGVERMAERRGLAHVRAEDGDDLARVGVGGPDARHLRGGATALTSTLRRREGARQRQGVAMAITPSDPQLIALEVFKLMIKDPKDRRDYATAKDHEEKKHVF